ncbi:MAG: bifunctional UDP-N-acetylglucosamine diphosphorylase/glucosamine-1-phosphate N-acetyltransferase GlmU [Propionibacteriaceae bacterium]
MKSKRSKLLHEVCGRSLISYAITAASALEPEHLVVVVGHQREQVSEHVHELAPWAVQAVQESQLGTGHAVRCGLETLPELTGDVVVTYGDVPLLTGETLAGLVAEHQASGNTVTVLTAVVESPTGYGRIVREHGAVARIVEEKDATDDERSIREINSGIYVFDAATLNAGLASLRSDNASGELYLTDVVTYANGVGGSVGAHLIDDPWQTEGVNDRVQLAGLSRELNRRILEKWMRAGVTVLDPATTWVADTVDLAEDVTLLPNTILRGATSIAEGATIGPDTMLTDVEVGPGASVTRTHATLAVIGEGAEVGPYSFIRPGTRLGVHGKIGAFVEAKNATIGDGAKVPHLTYCGDADVGDGANIGAGTIFANYDGVHKHRTRVGKASFIGSNSVLVAPVEIADGAYVAAGSAITDAVGPGDLAIARGRQSNIPGWVSSRRAGSKTEAAAIEALGAKEGDQ